MIVWWVALLVLHQGYSLVPVITVQLGEPVTFTCTLPDVELSSRQLSWYKQSAGDTLKLIVTQKKFAQPDLYHSGNSQRTSNYTVVQWPTLSDPVRPGDSVTLQCSVLSDSDNKTCPGDHSVYWFRAGAAESHPDIIYTDGKRRDDCEKKPDPRSAPKSCVYRFSKNVSSADAGTYYCAVATCGEILFGNGTTLQIAQTTHTESIALGIVAVCLVISVVGNCVLICNQRVEKYKDKIFVSLYIFITISFAAQIEVEDKLNYAALNFSERKATRGRKKRKFAEESFYSEVNCL
ncbi:uncharacterized protein [Trachinotus anak]|uniref:uncharacterized protein n=1 Tax=Trachinotus anak TaxID=443729 RepID=UPI0039F23143